MSPTGERTRRHWGRTAVALFSACSLLVVDTSCHVMKITKVDVTPGGVIISGSIQANVNQAPYSLSLSQVQRL